MSVVRVILVGLGARSRIWQRVLDEDPRTEIVGLVEANPAALAAAMQDRAGIVGGASIAEVAGRVDADAVILVTPPNNRDAQIAQACEAGLAILAEKPLADSVAIATTVKLSGRPLPPSCTMIASLHSAALRTTPWLLATPRAVPLALVTLTWVAWSGQVNR